jgi:hypothetical protein
VVVARAAVGQTTFGAPVQVSPQGTPTDKPWIGAMSDGSVLVTHLVQHQFTIGGARTTDGKTWQTMTIDTSEGLVQFPFVCHAPGTKRVYVAYYGAGDNDQNVILKWSEDGGASWNNRSVPSSGDGPIAIDDISCVASGDDVWVGYGQSNDDPYGAQQVLMKDQGIRIAHSSDQGKTWTRFNAHPAESGVYMHPFIVGDGSGKIDVAYYVGKGEGDTGASVKISRSNDGKTWGQGETIRDHIDLLGTRAQAASYLSEYYGFTAGSGNVYLTYVDNSQGMAHVGFYRGPAAAQ